ncbi:MAG TPA: ABC transporter permease [Chloroflexota bacterium]
MVAFIGRRLVTLPLILAVVGLVVFVLVHVAPGDPAAVMAGADASAERIEQIRHQMGLDRPLAVQFVEWLGGIARGDLGTSFFLQQPVAVALGDRLEPTLLLSLYSLVISALIGFPAGILAAIRRNSWLDRLTMVVSLAGISMPGFWLGILLILLFAVNLHLLPAAGYVAFSDSPGDNLRSLLMPAFSLGLGQAGLLARIVRSSMLEILREDYVRTARAKGLRARLVLVRHALPNILVPALTVVGISAGVLLGGAIVTETLFNIPGVGRLVGQSVLRRDFPVIQGAVLFIATIYVLVNLLVDVAYTLVDPRIRHGGR